MTHDSRDTIPLNRDKLGTDTGSYYAKTKKFIYRARNGKKPDRKAVFVQVVKKENCPESFFSRFGTLKFGDQDA
jgi:hypothetical protein